MVKIFSTELDRELADELSPLVELQAKIRVPQYPNNLCLGYHYCVAHSNHEVPEDAVGLYDWNLTYELHKDLMNNLDGVFICYGTASLAQRVRSIADATGGFFNSVAVTRYRQRYVFLRNLPETRSIIDKHGAVFNSTFLNAVLSQVENIVVYTDILAQAESVVESGLGMPSMGKFRILKKSMPKPASVSKSSLDIFVFSAPCTFYMLQNRDAYLSLEVLDSYTQGSAEYDTHCLWHVPRVEGMDTIDSLIRDVLGSYHSKLFNTASLSESSEEFRFLRQAYGEIVGIQHPSFVFETFSTPEDFRKCLADHHCNPRREV